MVVPRVEAGRRLGDILAEAQILVFDFDGVILESVEVKTEGYRAMYAAHGAQIADRVVAHHKANGGMSRFDKFRLYHRRFLGIDLDDEGVGRLAEQFGAIVEDLVVACAFVPGAEATLRHLAASSRQPCIASATPQEELERIVRRRGIRDLVGRIYGAPVKKVDVLRSVAETASIDPSCILMIGDAPQDREAAVSAGTAFVLRIIPASVRLFPAELPAVPDMRLDAVVRACSSFATPT